MIDFLLKSDFTSVIWHLGTHFLGTNCQYGTHFYAKKSCSIWIVLTLKLKNKPKSSKTKVLNFKINYTVLSLNYFKLKQTEISYELRICTWKQTCYSLSTENNEQCNVNLHTPRLKQRNIKNLKSHTKFRYTK